MTSFIYSFIRSQIHKQSKTISIEPHFNNTYTLIADDLEITITEQACNLDNTTIINQSNRYEKDIIIMNKY